MKNMILFLGLLLCLYANSPAACYSYDVEAGGWKSSNYSNCGGSGSIGVYVDCNFSFPANTAPCCWGTRSQGFVNASSSHYYCPTPSIVTYRVCDAVNGKGSWAFKFTVRCDTQAEVDSMLIAEKCSSGTMVKDTVGSTIFDACKNGPGLLIAFNDPITGTRNSSIGYYIVTNNSADLLDEATYNHLASLACTEVSLYRGVLNGKYVYWYSTDHAPTGVVNVVRIK